MWLALAERGDSAIVDTEPLRALHWMVDLIAGDLDDAGPEQMVGMDVAGRRRRGAARGHVAARPPTDAGVLEVVGRTHPDKTVAKAARRSLAKLRSRG